MSDFFNSGWSIYVSVIAIGGIIFCVWLLWTQRSWLSPTKEDEESAHVWDGNITELNTTVPRWWTIMYIGLCVIAFGYLILYPGLGSFKGVFGFTAAKQVQQQQQQINERLAPIYERFREMPISEIAADEEALSIGQRLFLNNCAQCHGSDAQGSPSFPNLTDKTWLWGGEPEQILQTITNGRRGIMTAHQNLMTPAQASEIDRKSTRLNSSHVKISYAGGGAPTDPYTLSLHDALPILFLNNCAQCHGSDAQGSPSFPNLTDKTWLWGGEPEQILQTITNGRRGIMTAHQNLMTPAQASE